MASRARKFDDTWCVVEERFRQKSSLAAESIFTMANGYMGVRGFMEEGGDFPSEAGTYMSGVFDNYDKHYVDLVNVPNFLFTRISVGGEVVNLTSGRISCYRRVLDMRNATLRRQFRFVDSTGRATELAFERFLSMDDVHTAVQRLVVRPINHSSKIEIVAGIDGTVTNIRQFDNPLIRDIILDDHLDEVKKGAFGRNGGYLSVVTKHTAIEIAQAFSVEAGFGHSSRLIKRKRFVARRLAWEAERGGEYCLTKYVSVFSSRDRGVKSPVDRALKHLSVASGRGYEEVLRRHTSAWAGIWEDCDIVIKGSASDQQAVRFNIYHLVCGNSRDDDRASIGPRLLTHTRYKGCAFWDVEIFMLPFFIYTDPMAARSLLMYRYHLLGAARKRASEGHLDGAQYPWMSANDGSEQCQAWAYADCEIHITADIAYGVERYFLATGDEDFMVRYGAEMLVETARYWATRSHYSEEKRGYVIPVVKGPDEYCGVTSNNAFTNMMAANNLRAAAKAVEFVREKDAPGFRRLCRKIRLRDDEAATWRKIAGKMYVNRDSGGELIIQDDNFLDTTPWDVKGLMSDGRPAADKLPYSMLHRIRIIKQADVILLMYLLNERFTREEKFAAWKFYLPLTVHDSSLSYNTHAIVALELGFHKLAYDFFRKTARLDLDIKIGNTDKGVHAASLGGLWQTVVNGFAGMRIRKGLLSFDPHLPKAWRSLVFHVRFRGRKLRVDVKRSGTNVVLVEGDGPVKVMVRGNKVTVKRGSGAAIR